jgi:hypothetical protein
MAAACLTVVVAGCATQHPTQRSDPTMQTSAPVPNANVFTTAPLRHRLRVELNAPVPEVWAIVGRHDRMPEYSAGIASVRIEQAPDGTLARVCQFRSPDGTGAGPEGREQIRWEAANIGYATTAEAGNPFGLSNDLSLVTVEPAATGTLFTWDQHYDAADPTAVRGSFDDAFADMATRLVARFGGRVVERYMDGTR